MREIELPDGKIAQFEDNTPDDVIYSFAKDYIDKNVGDAKPPTPENQGIMGQAMDFAKGIPQGLGNKAVGLTQSIASAVAPDSEFSNNLANEVSKLKQRQSNLPEYERAGITGGEILSDIALSPTKGAGLVGKAAIGGAASGLTTPLEQSDQQSRLNEIGKDAALSALTGKALQTGGDLIGATKEGTKNLITGIKARIPEELETVSQGLKKQGSDIYDQMKKAGAIIRPNVASQIVKTVERKINDFTETLPELHGKTLAVVNKMKNAINESDLSLDKLDKYRQLLGRVVKDGTDVSGKVDSDGTLASVAIDKLDDVVNKLRPKYLINSGNPEAVNLLNQAREHWQRYAKFDKISNLVAKADGDPNKIKSTLNRFVSSKKNLRGFNSNEIEALKAAGKNTTGEGTLKMLGKFGLDFGSSFTMGNTALPAIGAAAVGYGKGLSAGGATLAIGTAARQAQKYIARGKLENALNIIQNSSNPSQVISKIPNEKLRSKILEQYLKNISIATPTLAQ